MPCERPSAAAEVGLSVHTAVGLCRAETEERSSGSVGPSGADRPCRAVGARQQAGAVCSMDGDSRSAGSRHISSSSLVGRSAAKLHRPLFKGRLTVGRLAGGIHSFARMSWPLHLISRSEELLHKAVTPLLTRANPSSSLVTVVPVFHPVMKLRVGHRARRRPGGQRQDNENKSASGSMAKRRATKIWKLVEIHGKWQKQPNTVGKRTKRWNAKCIGGNTGKGV